jgi:hypothetical protein
MLHQSLFNKINTPTRHGFYTREFGDTQEGKQDYPEIRTLLPILIQKRERKKSYLDL